MVNGLLERKTEKGGKSKFTLSRPSFTFFREGTIGAVAIDIAMFTVSQLPALATWTPMVDWQHDIDRASIAFWSHIVSRGRKNEGNRKK
jgi:hypothetical protein